MYHVLNVNVSGAEISYTFTNLHMKEILIYRESSVSRFKSITNRSSK